MKALKHLSIDSKFSYDGHKCHAIYLDYVQDSAKLELLMYHLRMYTIMRIRRTYGKRIKPDVCEDLVSALTAELWKIVGNHSQQPRLPVASVAVFHSFLNTVLRRKAAETFRKAYDDSHKHVPPRVLNNRWIARSAASEYTGHRLFLEDLPEDLKRATLHLFRFPPNWRDAAGAVFDSFLRNEPAPSPAGIRQIYGVSDPSFLIDHVRVRMKQALYEMKDTVEWRTNRHTEELLNESVETILGTGRDHFDS